jgi:hypothetical protein
MRANRQNQSHRRSNSNPNNQTLGGSSQQAEIEDNRSTLQVMSPQGSPFVMHERYGQALAVQDDERKEGRDKTQHLPGDLHYGFGQPRQDGLDALVERRSSKKDSHPPPTSNDPLAIDELNKPVLAIFKQGNDRFDGYLTVMEKIGEGRLKPSHGIQGEWFSFLRKNICYLSIDKHLAQVDDLGDRQQPSPKDRLIKNSKPRFSMFSYDQKRAIIGSRRLERFFNPAESLFLDDWLTNVFTRRLCKLGIDFTLQRGNVVHMNVFSPVYGADGADGADGNVETKGLHPPSSVLYDAQEPHTSRQPYTYSEFRHIVRRFGLDHPQIDLYYKRPNEHIRRHGVNSYIDHIIENQREERERKSKKCFGLVLKLFKDLNFQCPNEDKKFVGQVNYVLGSDDPYNVILAKLRKIAVDYQPKTNTLGSIDDSQVILREYFGFLITLPDYIHQYGQPGVLPPTNKAIHRALDTLITEISDILE